MNRITAMKIVVNCVVAVAFVSIGAAVHAAADVLELVWDDLIPEDYVLENPLKELSDEEYANLMDGSEEAERLMSELRAVWDHAPVVEKLNGMTVRLPGFVVPLDFEAEKITEFLLVPYFGACIHVPPPPANQIVFVKSDRGIEIDRLYDAVIIQGEMETAAVSSELAQAGYTLHATDVSPYSADPE
jgi:uncharacterized protein